MSAMASTLRDERLELAHKILERQRFFSEHALVWYSKMGWAMKYDALQLLSDLCQRVIRVKDLDAYADKAITQLANDDLSRDEFIAIDTAVKKHFNTFADTVIAHWVKSDEEKRIDEMLGIDEDKRDAEKSFDMDAMGKALPVV